MSKEWQTQYGKVVVNKEVIAKIAGLAAMECYGLIGMSSRNVQDGLADLLGWENLTKGITVNIEDDVVSIELNIIVVFGTNIQQVAANAMERVNYVVNEKLGIEVSRVDINVQGVRVQDEDR
ncbi:MAG: Asp23/Gls24 family envelope stress response protein [Bacillota bacterium]